ncbi:uncharacterized protein LOC121794226 isoform X1 [Salvia splendens]|uniref:uncharacterized protein LOC121794226 isoform X1 n=1 Tax=Salvia splendens TaxID=180675 RepID=UPI001C263B67|nr:uncharacterized protein LOC121794226 isoform X1 [Salvia splendens]
MFVGDKLGLQNLTIIRIRRRLPNPESTTFIVGNWKRDSNLKGDLTAKFYYGMKKLVWEFLLNGPLKTKMEVCWSDITAIEAVINPNQPGFLRIELAKPPLFFREIPPQPRKRTTWEPADDFTNGQAQLCRKHEATFPPGALDKHYEKLLISDGRLVELSRMPFPTNESVFPLQQIPQQQLSSSVLPLQHIPKLQFHHSLNSNIIAASGIVTIYIHILLVVYSYFYCYYTNPNYIYSLVASSNGVKGNEMNNEPTFVDSSRQNHPLDLDQQLYQYNDMAINSKPTFVASSSHKPVAVPASTFVEPSRQNHPLVVPEQRLYQHN